MQGKIKVSLDVMAVVTDKAQRKTEAVNVDQVYVVSQYVDWLNQLAQFTLAIGGKDSSGRLSICPELRDKLARISIKDETFRQYFATPEGNPKTWLTADEQAALFADVLIPMAYKLVWSEKGGPWDRDDVEIVVGIKTVDLRAHA